MFVVIVFAFWLLARVLSRLLRTSLDRFKATSNLLREFLVSMVRRITMLIGIVVAISKLGVDIGPLIAAIGAAGLVIGFALQGTLSNFASGIMILLYRPFDVGDVVDVAGVTGKVEAMTMVSTSVNTFDNRLVVVPNNSIWNNVITNITGKATRRVDMVFGISYADDIDAARAILEEIVADHDRVLKDPEPNIKLHELADSSVNFVVRPWARTDDYWDVYWDVTREVKRRFDAAGISIPFPQREVHIVQESKEPAVPVVETTPAGPTAVRS
jgi:small conductance mechanosensitive channel